MNDDEKWMHLALSLAESARFKGDVPVGAIIVRDERVIASGFNRREADNGATHHAEILAIDRACKTLKAWRLLNCRLYVTLEPCIMCAGAIIQSRIPLVTFGTPDPKGGAFGSLYNLQEDNRLNHRVTVTSGVLADRCSADLTAFFRSRRLDKKAMEP